MAKYLTVAQLEKQFDTMLRSLKELARVKILEPVTLIADQAKAIADSVRRDADNGLFDGMPGERGPRGDRGERGEPGGVTTVNGRNGTVTLTASDVGARPADWYPAVSNRNLLDNPWLTVNQRGVTELTGGGAYNMDRWRCAALTGASIDSLGRVTLTSGTLYQNLESNLWTQLSGKTLTASVRLANGTVISGGPLAFAGETAEFPGLNGTGWVMTMKSDAKTFELYHAQGYGSVTVRAVKLEVGGVSTLQYDVAPDYAAELAKCRRYYYRIAASGSRNLFLPVSTNAASTGTAYLSIPLPTSMRTTPVISMSAASDLGLTQSTAANANWCSAAAVYTASSDNAFVELRVNAELTTNAAYVFIMKSGGWIEFVADL